MGEKKILFLVSVRIGCQNCDYYIVAPDETTAAKRIEAACKEWGYDLLIYVSNIKRLAEEGRYGNPEILLFA